MGTDTNDLPRNTIIFQSNHREVMRISPTGVTIPEDLTIDEAAAGVIAALEKYVVGMVEREVQKEREACAQICDHAMDVAINEPMRIAYGNMADAIRNRI